MNEEQAEQKDLLDTTDCLEAVGVFRGWKNFLFVIVICCLLLLQVSFWLVNTGYVKAADEAKGDVPAVAAEDTEQIKEAAKQVVTDPCQQQAGATEAAPQQPEKQARALLGLTFKPLARLIRFFDFVLILAAALYCLTMLFSLKVSLLGRLGGINHISRAFFLSLVFLVLLLPWQKFFPGIVAGAIYTPQELLDSSVAVETKGIFGIAFYYLRFTGYWLVVVLLLIFSQFRSSRWAKAILRRLEAI